VATSVPATPTTKAVIPAMGEAGTYVSDLMLSNADLLHPVDITVSLALVGGPGPPLLATLTLPPGASQTIADALPTIFGIGGQGTIGIHASAPVAVAYRIASRQPEGDYAVIATALDGSEAIDGGGSAAFGGVAQSDSRRTDVLLFNDGVPGTVTVIAQDGTGQEIGRLSVNLGAEQPLRVNAVFAQLGATSAGDGQIVVQTSPGMSVYALAAQVDISGDLEVYRLQTVQPAS